MSVGTPGNITISLSDCEFIGNVINTGSQYLQVASNSFLLTVNDCAFQYNQNLILTATNGLTITNCQFTNNTLLGTGNSIAGGLIQSSGGQCAIQYCSFSNNMLTSTDPIPMCKGGVIYIAHRTSISNCSFIKNTISNCQAVYGGVLHFTLGAENSATSGNLFEKNFLLHAVSIDGGVIYYNDACSPYQDLY